LITWDYPPQPTGLGRAAGEIAAGLTEAGAKVTVFSLDRTGEERAGGVRILGCAVPERSALARLRRRAGAGHLAVPWQVRRAVSAHDAFDVIETTNWYAPGALVDRRSALVVRNSTPAIEARDPEASLRDRADLTAAHRLEAFAAKRADAVISNADHHRKAIEAWYGLRERKHHIVIPLSLSGEWLDAGRGAPPPFGGASPSILFVGRAERRKGFRELIEGFIELRRSHEAELHLAGLGEEGFAEGCRDLSMAPAVRGSITVHGRVGDEEMAQLFRRADIVAAPSRYESYGLVYREAAAFGRPLLACAEDPSASALLNEHPIGVLAKRCDGHAVAEGLKTLLENPDRARRMGAAGLRMAEGLSRRQLGLATLNLYEEALRLRRA
jgi:glycosyltransferase involved in cell wall biosynthesis